MNPTLSIHCNELSDEDIQELAADIAATLNRETDLDARPAEETGGAGHKGDALTIGQIVLTAFTSGAVVALINVLKSYVERKSSLTFEVQCGEHQKISIRAENMDEKRFDETVQKAREILGDRG